MVWSFSQSKVEPVSTHLKALFFSPKVGVCDDTWILLLAVPGNVHGVCRSMCARCSDHLTSGWSSMGAQRYKKKLQRFHGFLWRISVCYLKSLKSLSKPQPSSFFSMFFACLDGSSPVFCETSKGFQPLQVATAPPLGTWRRSGRASRTRNWRLKGSSRQRRPGNCWPPGAATESCHGSLVGGT